MKNKKRLFLIFVSFLVIINLFIIININRKNGFYIGKIESIEKNEDLTILVLSPVDSNRSFAHEIKANHKIEYKDSITISGLKERFKKSKDNYLGQLDEVIDNIKVRDSIIFKVNDYDKENYKLDISELAVDLTLD